MTKNNIVKGVLYLAKDGMHALEEHHFDGTDCLCSLCQERKKFVPTRIVVPN